MSFSSVGYGLFEETYCIHLRGGIEPPFGFGSPSCLNLNKYEGRTESHEQQFFVK